MNRRAAVLLLCGLLLAPLASPAAARARDPLVPRAFFFTAAQSAQNPAPAAETQPPRPNVTAYALPPALYEKAHHLGQIEFWFALLGFAYGVVLLWLILKWRLAPKYRDWAEKASRNRFVQAAILAPLLILTIDALSLPLDIHQQWVDRRYGLSIQSWPSWMWDWTKSELLTVIGGAIVVYILYAVIRKSPRRWWFYFWLVSLPLGLLVVFAQPLVVDPMFHKFEPLAQKDPALTASLERLARHIGENIPPERMFWMGASEKSTELNAYVTGFGASKRIVVWDTTVAKMNTPQIVFVAGHEMGHYVLRHIPKGIALGALFSLLLFYLAFRSMGTRVAYPRRRRSCVAAGPALAAGDFLLRLRSDRQRRQPPFRASSRSVRTRSHTQPDPRFRRSGRAIVSGSRRSRSVRSGAQSRGRVPLLHASAGRRPHSFRADLRPLGQRRPRRIR